MPAGRADGRGTCLLDRGWICDATGRVAKACTVSYTAAGSCVIDANQAGNGTYAAASQAQLTIKVVNNLD